MDHVWCNLIYWFELFDVCEHLRALDNMWKCHGPCSVTFFLKNNQRTAPTEPPMMATSPLFSATITTSHPCRTYIGAPSEYFLHSDTVTTSTDSGFTAMIGYSQYLIMPKHLSKELAEPMNINWKTSSQVSTGLRMDKCQSSNIVINNRIQVN